MASCSRCGKPEHHPHPRYYCPRCGSVMCASKLNDVPTVLPHYKRNDVNPVRTCLGGTVDPVKDRAP
jgi:DNA-directed RNA polymerase subunit RPC12/RpoP